MFDWTRLSTYSATPAQSRVAPATTEDVGPTLSMVRTRDYYEPGTTRAPSPRRSASPCQRAEPYRKTIWLRLDALSKTAPEQCLVGASLAVAGAALTFAFFCSPVVGACIGVVGTSVLLYVLSPRIKTCSDARLLLWELETAAAGVLRSPFLDADGLILNKIDAFWASLASGRQSEALGLLNRLPWLTLLTLGRMLKWSLYLWPAEPRMVPVATQLIAHVLQVDLPPDWFGDELGEFQKVAKRRVAQTHPDKFIGKMRGSADEKRIRHIHDLMKDIRAHLNSPAFIESLNTTRLPK